MNKLILLKKVDRRFGLRFHDQEVPRKGGENPLPYVLTWTENSAVIILCIP